MPRRGENIYKRKDGRWEGRYLCSYDEIGNRKYKSVYARTYSEVKEKLNNLKATGQPTYSKTGTRFQKYCYEWLATVKLRHKESTYCKYCNTCKNQILPVFEKMNIEMITTNFVERFLQSKLEVQGLSPKTVNDILCVLKLIFSYAEDCGVRTVCNFSHLHIRQNTKNMRVLSVSEQSVLTEYLLDNIDFIKLGIYLSLFTGIRIGELCALKWENINLYEKMLYVTKTMQRIQTYDMLQKTKVIISSPKSACSLREIPLPDFLCDMLKKYKRADDCFLLSASVQEYVEPRALQYKFKKIIKDCGLIDVNFHALRHTFATRCVEADFEIKTLSEILGHSSVKITLDRYVHSSMELKRKNMEKLVGVI